MSSSLKPSHTPSLVVLLLIVPTLYVLLLCPSPAFSIASQDSLSEDLFHCQSESNEVKDGELKLNDRPVIGILAQEYYHDVPPAPAEPIHAYIAASYVKWVESAGGRVVPIMINRSDDYYVNLVGQLNGILFPGGGVYLDSCSGYGRAAAVIWKEVLRLNGPEVGQWYPLWGTCLGFEEIAYLATHNRTVDDQLHRTEDPKSERDRHVGKWITKCRAEDVALPLDLTAEVSDSRLFAKLDDKLLKILTGDNVTANYHSRCLTVDNFYASELNDSYRLLATNRDLTEPAAESIQFVSAFEHRQFPIYGVQFHPEKNLFEFYRRAPHLLNVPHSQEAIRAGQYFANFFVDECRKNHNQFKSETEESDLLIYNYDPIRESVLHPKQAVFEQVYLFPLAYQSDQADRVDSSR